MAVSVRNCIALDARGQRCVIGVAEFGVHDHRAENGGWAVRLTEQEGGPPNDAVAYNEEDYRKMQQNSSRDVQVVTDWWMDLAKEEVDRCVAKAVEYGSTDLADIGHMLARTQGRTVTNEEAAEMGCYFYLVGKLGRWTAAMSRGDRVSDDTLHDIGVYVRMTQRIRAVGGWPFNPEDERKS